LAGVYLFSPTANCSDQNVSLPLTASETGTSGGIFVSPA
jgi:hypothetical protein